MQAVRKILFQFNTLFIFSLLLIAPLFVPAHADEASWRQIDVPAGAYQITDANGMSRQIAPSCSGGPVCILDPQTGQPNCHTGDKAFHFYFKPGEKDKLMVYFDGGGACWSDHTCITAALSGFSAYVPEIPVDANPAGKKGVFDLGNEDNPYRDWSMVYIPYCTGDIHWGSQDTQYTDFTGAITGTPGGKVPIHHRGFDNFLYVQNWLKSTFSKKSKKHHLITRKSRVKKLLVTGSSAGAYGAAFSYAHLKHTFPNAKGYLLADAGTGVVSDALLQQVFNPPADRWGSAQNLVQFIPGMPQMAQEPADTFAISMYGLLANYYPNDRFAQYTTHWDATQVLFSNIMQHENDPSVWLSITPELYQYWVTRMLGIHFANAANANYRFYLAPGCKHTVLRFNDDFYARDRGQVPFRDWFAALTGSQEEADERHEHDASLPAWENSFCTDCGAPPNDAQAFAACLARGSPTN